MNNNNTFKWSLEILPRHVGEVHQLPQLVEEIYVTMIPGSDISEVIQASADLIEQGRTPIPHIAVSYTHLTLPTMCVV